MTSEILKRAAKEYYARENSPWTNEDARAIGPELERLQLKTDSEVVLAVREHPEEYPEVHSRLTWHDQSAAHRYRSLEIQAMRRAVYVRISTEDGETIETRAFVRVPLSLIEENPPVSEADGRGPQARVGITLETALDHRDTVGPRVLREARSYFLAGRRRFNGYRSLFKEEDPKLAALFEKLDELDSEDQPQSEAA